MIFKMNTLLFKLCMVPLLWFTYPGVHAQSEIIRVEFPAERDKDPYELVSLGERGVLVLFAQNQMLTDNNRSWHFVSYDTSLAKVWEIDVPVLNNARYRHSFLAADKLYLFFHNPEKIKDRESNYQLSEINLSSGVIDHYTGYIPDAVATAGFRVAGDRAVLAADLRSEQAAVFFIHFRNQSFYAYITDFGDQNFTEDLRVDPADSTLLFVVSNFVSRKQNRLVVLRLSPDGNLLGTYPVTAVMESKYLNSARICPIGPENHLVVGTYSNIASKIPGSKDYYGIESAGFFVTRLEKGVQQYMNYYNFMELKNLRPTLSARDFLKLAKKKSREDVEYSADYELNLHTLEKAGDTYILLGEAFYPDFRTVSDISYDYWGRPITQTYTVFEGYRVYQSMLLGFDADGNLQWDNSIEMNSANTEDLSARAGFLQDDKPTVLFYNDGKRITYRAYAGNALVEGNLYTDLETAFNGDKIVEVGDNFMIPWYNNYYLTYGYHTIRNNYNEPRDNRTFYYINKINFE